MPRFTIIQEPLQGQHSRKSIKRRKNPQPIYIDRLRQVLITSKNHNNTINLKQQNRRHSLGSQAHNTNQSKTQDVIYIIKQPTQQNNKETTPIKLPKLKKKHKFVKYSQIDKNQKSIIKNYMNAKLVEFKTPKKNHKNKKLNCTLDSIGQLPDQNCRKYYMFRKATPSEILSNSRINKSVDYQDQIKPISTRTIITDKNRPNKSLSSIPYKTNFGTNTITSQDSYSCHCKDKKSQIYSYTDSMYKALQTQYQHNSEFTQKQKDIQKNWEKINPLNLETYFVKLKRIGNTPHGTAMEKTKNKLPSIPISKEEISKFIKNYIPQFSQLKVDDVVKNQKFQIIHDDTEGNKQLYFGEVQDGKKHGQGVMLTQKYWFQGFWDNDKKIRGVQKNQGGKYKGDFKEDKRQGKGQFFWVNGEYYSGQWKNGKKHGSGYWKSKKGESYMGEWRNGEVTGYGVHTMKNGQKYEGQFLNFLKHGFGTELFPNKDYYEGKYSQGQPHGKGKYVWKNGIIFNGDFVQGFRTGKGTISAENILQFEGNFNQQRIHGMGCIKYPNGDIFNGLFQNNKKNGHGIIQLKSEKKIIKGVWAGDQLIRQSNI